MFHAENRSEIHLRMVSNVDSTGLITAERDGHIGERCGVSPPVRLQLDPTTGGPVPVLSRFDLHDGNALWKVRCSQSVPRTADALSAIVAPLLRISEDFLLVDPYFASKPEEYLSLVKMLQDANAAGKSLKRVEVHTGTKGTATFIQDKARTSLVSKLPKGVEIKVFQWIERKGGELLHDRFVLTDRGGIKSSVGWDTGKSGQTTEASLMDDDSYRQRWDQYQRETAAFNLAGEPFVIKACR